MTVECSRVTTGDKKPAVDGRIMVVGEEVAAAAYHEDDLRRRTHNAEIELGSLYRQLDAAVASRKQTVKQFKRYLPPSGFKRFWRWLRDS